MYIYNSQNKFYGALISIEYMCLMMSHKVLSHLGMLVPNHPMHDAFNQELLREKLYNLDALRELFCINVPLLNPQQKYVFDTLIRNVLTRRREYGTYLATARRHRRRMKMQKRDELRSFQPALRPSSAVEED